MVTHTTRNGHSMGHKRWLPCRAWDFKSLMYPTVFCSKLFGYFPYKYKNDEYVITKIRLAFAAFVVCFLLAFQIFTLYMVNLSDPNDNILGTLSENFLVLLDGSMPMAMFLTSYSRSFMFRRVSRVSRILSPQDFNDMAKFQHLLYIVHFLYYMWHMLIFYVDKQNILVARRYINLFVVMISFEAVLLYLNCVCVLGACFKKVNESLKQLSQSEMAEEYLSRRQGAMLLMKVKYYEDLHEEISDAVGHLNKSSRTININFTVGTFVLVTLCAYMPMQWIAFVGIPSINDYWFIECSAYGILRLMQFVLLVWVCETAMGHAKEINTTIYSLANNCRDDTVKRELKYFALQIVHRDNEISTSAFKINGKLLSQILNGIAMYIMILFQFLMSSNCTN